MRKLALCKHTATEWLFMEITVVYLDHFNRHQSCAFIASSNDAFALLLLSLLLLLIMLLWLPFGCSFYLLSLFVYMAG